MPSDDIANAGSQVKISSFLISIYITLLLFKFYDRNPVPGNLLTSFWGWQREPRSSAERRPRAASQSAAAWS